MSRRPSFFNFFYFLLFFFFFKKYEKLFRLDKFRPRLGIAICLVFIPFTMRLNDASTCISFSLCRFVVGNEYNTCIINRSKKEI